MRKTEDPFTKLIQVFGDLSKRNSLQKGAAIGKIISPPPEIQVSYNGMILDKTRLWIDEYWLQGHARTARGHIISATQERSGGSGDSAFASHNHDIDNDYTDSIIYTDTWKAGDLVELTPLYSTEDKTAGQQFIISKKLVRLDGN